MNFTIYSKRGCPYCDKIKQVLSAINQPYTDKLLDVDFTRDQFYQQFGEGSTFPRVLVNGSLIGGCNESVVYLKNQGLV
jgi:glutaredoxin